MKTTKSWLLIPATLALVLTGCSSTIEGTAVPEQKGTVANSIEQPKEKSALAPTSNANLNKINPADPPNFRVTGGELRDATLLPKTGNAKKVSIQDGEISLPKLAYSSSYTLKAETDEGTVSRKLKTVTPNNLTMPYVNFKPKEVVGVGFSIGIRFDEAIPNKELAEKSIVITSEPSVEVKPYWINEKEVRYRPATYWTPGTKVSVKVNSFGHNYGAGLYGEKDFASSFSIGERVVTKIDDATKQMTVFRNYKPLRTIPVSLGKPSDPTNPGTYIVNDELDHMIMDSSTYGVPVNSANGYRTPVDFATQISYSGIYVHAAPWSEWAQGNTNQSHGCVNVSTEAAKWFQGVVKRGDPVEVRNTEGQVLPVADGLGDWNLSWAKWSKGNAN